MNQLAWVEGNSRSLLLWEEPGCRADSCPWGRRARSGGRGLLAGEGQHCHFRGLGMLNRWSFHIPIEEF